MPGISPEKDAFAHSVSSHLPFEASESVHVLIVDSHCHVSPCWYEPVESLIGQMDRNGVGHAVLVQMQGQYDNEYQFECERRYPGRFASVVLVDPSASDAPQRLECLAAQGAKGVRLRPDDPQAVWRASAELGLVVSCFGAASAFASAAFAEILDSFPTLPVIIEHLGGIAEWDEAVTETVRDEVFALGRCSNAYIKIHGLGEFCRRRIPVTTHFPFERSDLRLLHRACDAFAGRVMWGSDFPPVSFREGYANALQFPLHELETTSHAECAEIFGGLAARLFGLAAER